MSPPSLKANINERCCVIAAGESEAHIIGAEEADSGFQRATRKTYALYSKDLGMLKRIHVQQLGHSSSGELIMIVS